MECDLQIVEFVSPSDQGSASTHGIEVAVLVDNQFDHQDDQDHDPTDQLEELDDDDLDSSYEAHERIAENLVDWHLVNDDKFFGELDIFIDIFAQQDSQDDEGYCSPSDE